MKRTINIKAVKDTIPASLLERAWQDLCRSKGISRKMPEMEAFIVTDREFTRLCSLFRKCRSDFADLFEHGRVLRPEETAGLCFDNEREGGKKVYTIVLRKASRYSDVFHELNHIIDQDFSLIREIKT